jgi:hypothetical protein
MKQIPLITSILLAAASGAFAQSDEEILERLRTSVTRVFLEQASWVLPESFHNSELPASDKERIVLQLATDTANCLADAAVEYATLNNIPLSELVSSDATIRFDGDSVKEFNQLYDPCISRVWKAAGIRQR